MKRIITTLTFVLSFVVLGFSQEAGNTAISQGKEQLSQSKESGVYLFTLPAENTSEHVEKVKAYYKTYFTVDFNETSKEATLTMIGDDPKMCRMVMMRFMSSCKVAFFDVDGTAVSFNEFRDSYLK